MIMMMRIPLIVPKIISMTNDNDDDDDDDNDDDYNGKVMLTMRKKRCQC